MSEVDLTLDDAWNDTEPVAAEPVETEPVETKDAEATEDKTEVAEEKTEVIEEKTEVDSPSESEEKSEPWYIYKAMDEKNKRQALEKKLADIEADKTPEEPTSFLDDEDKARGEIEAGFQDKLDRAILQVKEESAVEVLGKEKVETATTWFNEIAQTAAGFAVLKRFHESGNSIFEINRMHDEFMKMEQMQDAGTFEAKIRADERAKIIAEGETAKAETIEKTDSIAPSLATQTSSSNKEPVDDDLSLESVWNG